MFVKIFQHSTDEEMGEKSSQIHACMISIHTLEKNINMYSHANMPLGQSEHVYSIILVIILINMYNYFTKYKVSPHFLQRDPS